MSTQTQIFSLGTAALVALALASVLPALTACSNDAFTGPIADAASDAPIAEPTSSGEPDASDAGIVEAPPKEAPPGCDGSKLPAQDPCVVDEGLGIFVSKSLGNDASGDGTRAKPYATLQKAITAAGATQRRVYACNESYTESLVLVEGVSVFGYLDCKNNWAADATKHAKLTGVANPTVKVTKLTAPIRFDGFDVEAPLATAPSASSIAMIAADTKALVVANGKLVAHDAKAGGNGDLGPFATNAASAKGTGGATPGMCSISPSACHAAYAGGAGGTNVCGGVSGMVGGAGGHGGFGGRFARIDASNFIEVDPRTNGEGGTAQTALGGGELTHGQDGANGSDGNNGTSSAGGKITAEGWAPGDGTAGTNGSPGQGGGGGAGWGMVASDATQNGDWYGYSGAGGGAGGCPGMAGTPGKGGGASIALVSWNSGVRLESVAIQAGNGGDGGQGGAGTGNSPGGAGETYPTAHQQCRGGNGGWGGHSGWSGNGAGGSAIGVAYKGPLPDLGGATPVIGKAGKGQAQRVLNEVSIPTFYKTIPASADGVAQPTWSIP